MRILIYGLNFYPEIIGAGKYTHELATYLGVNNEVRVITANKYFPDWKVKENFYRKEIIKNCLVFRSPIYVPKRPTGFKRLIHLISFALTSLPNLLLQKKWKPQIVITIVPTILIAQNVVFFKNLYGNNCKIWLHVQDLEIDAAKELGMVKSDFLFKLIISFEKFIYKNFDQISTISNEMRGVIKKKINFSKEIYLIRNWIDTRKIKSKKENKVAIKEIRQSLNIKVSDTVIMYSGSISKKQDIDLLIYAIKGTSNLSNLRWILSIEGPSKEFIVKATKNIKNLLITNLKKESLFYSWLGVADIHVIPQKAGINKFLMPSKVIGMLASGSPIVATTNKNSELGKVISKSGIATSPGSKEGFLNAILYLSKNKELRNKLGKQAREIALNNYSQKNILNNFLLKLELLNS